METPTCAPQVLPSPNESFFPSAGTDSVSSVAVASPRSCNAAIVSRSTRRSHRAPSRATPCSSSIAINRRRCGGASAFVQASSMTAARSTGTTNIVRRMPSMRTTERRS